jgi:hypothetical protein
LELKNKGLLRIHYSVSDTFIRSHEVVHLIPGWRIGTGQIEATGAVLFDSGNFRQERVELSIMAKDNPSLRRNLANPLIIRSRLRKLKTAPRIMMIFN